MTRERKVSTRLQGEEGGATVSILGVDIRTEPMTDMRELG